MAIVSVPVRAYDFCSGLLITQAVHNGKKDRYGWPTYSYVHTVSEEFLKKQFNDNDTYLVVFGPAQLEEMEIFKKEFSKHIIYEAPMSCNTNHPGPPRNTLFVFEKRE